MKKSNKKEVSSDTLFHKLSSKGTPNRDGWIYISEGLYLNENDELVEMS